MAMIQSNNLAYLNWIPVASAESANISISELHTHLNHLPHPAVQHLLRNKSVLGLPDHVDNPTPNVFCEDCVNGKMMHALHTKLAVWAEHPLLWVFSDVHSPLPI